MNGQDDTLATPALDTASIVFVRMKVYKGNSNMKVFRPDLFRRSPRTQSLVDCRLRVGGVCKAHTIVRCIVHRLESLEESVSIDEIKTLPRR